HWGLRPRHRWSDGSTLRQRPPLTTERGRPDVEFLSRRQLHTPARGASTVDVQSLLGEEAEQLLSYESKAISRDDLSLPGPDFIDRVFAQSDRSPQVLRNLQ